MTRKFLISMTLIGLFVFSATNISFGKEQESGYTRSCILYFTYDVWDPFIRDYREKTDRIDLGSVSADGFGAAICEQRAHRYIQTHYRYLDTGI